MKKTLNVKSLDALNAERLSALLIEVSADNAVIKRGRRLELAGAQSRRKGREVRKRLATIGRTRFFVDWQTRNALIDDLETQRRTALERVSPEDPREVLGLMLRVSSAENRKLVLEPIGHSRA